MSSSFFAEEEQYDAESVTLVDEEGRSLECYIEQSLELEGTTYLLLLPVDSPIVIMAGEGDSKDAVSGNVMVEENEEIEAIFSDAKAVLSEQNLTLIASAFTLTAKGELPPLEEDKIVSLKFEEDSKIEPEELQLLTSFYHNDTKYSIYTPLTPLLFFARYDDNQELLLVSPEDENFQAILEELLFDDF